MGKLNSRKLWVAIGAGVVAIVGSLWPEQEDLAQRIVTLALGYIAAQGVVDAAEKIKGADK